MVKTRILIRWAVGLLALGLPLTAAHAQELGYEPHELVCALLPGANIAEINATYGTTTLAVLDTSQAWALSYLLGVPASLDEDSLADEIGLESSVVYCDLNYFLGAPEPVQRSQPFLDVQLQTEVETQAASARLGLPQSHLVTDGAGVRVAVIDVGVTSDHPYLTGSVGVGYDFIDQDSVAQDEPAGFAGGHGTFVAGVVHLVAPGAEIIPYRVLDTLGLGNGFTLAQAVIRAVEAGCRVINLSLAMSGKHPTLDDAIEYAKNSNVVVVAAAGNDSGDVTRFPADDSYCLGVAAVDSADALTGFSNYGSYIDLCAPGKDIKGPFVDTLYARWDGTSFAAPMVSGTAALLVALQPTADWNDLVDQLEATAENLDAVNPGFEGLLGAGLVSPWNAVQNSLVPGDVNGNGSSTSSDVVFLVNYVFKGGVPPAILAVADVDASCAITSADIVYLVDFIFRGGPTPLIGCAF